MPPGAGSIARPVDHQSSELPLYHGCTLCACVRPRVSVYLCMRVCVCGQVASWDYWIFPYEMSTLKQNYNHFGTKNWNTLYIYRRNTDVFCRLLPKQTNSNFYLDTAPDYKCIQYSTTHGKHMPKHIVPIIIKLSMIITYLYINKIPPAIHKGF